MLLSTAAYAQSAIVGVVKDTSGAAMPGVTVEASSDVLIEKVKSAVTDGDGDYRIADLRPGTYSVTFTLTGFKTFRRDGLQLPSEFTATVNAELGVGAARRNHHRHRRVAGRRRDDGGARRRCSTAKRSTLIPTGRSIQGLGQLVVGVSLSLPDTGGARAMQQTYMSTHGMTHGEHHRAGRRPDDQRPAGRRRGPELLQRRDEPEMSYQTSGIGAETSSGGVRLNMIPREGGNQFSGDFKAAQPSGRVAVEQPDRSSQGQRA